MPLPTFSPGGGSYTTPQSVTISESVPHATIYYTTDGSDPSRESTRYSGPITISTIETIKAFAIEDSYTDSDIAAAIYNVVTPTATPQLSPPPGTYTGPLTVTITDSTPGAVIYYTTDSTAPTTSSTVYTGSITIYATTYIEAVALAPGHSLSDVAAGKYVISDGLHNIWTWMNGSTDGSIVSVYGTLGAPDPANTPCGRRYGISWTDANNNLWLYGGEFAPIITTVPLADLWEFSPSTGNWTWWGGTQAQDVPPVYGTLGVAAASNTPGSRFAATSWTDASGNLWMFGGGGTGTTGADGAHNDLWMLNPSTKLWTWMGGGTALNAASNFGTVGVPAASNMPGGRTYSTGGVDSSGNFWMVGGNSGSVYGDEVWEYNPASNIWTWFGGAPAALAATAGTKGVADKFNHPAGSDLGFVGGMNQRNEFWIFGGRNNAGLTDTSWRFDLQTDWWTWVTGSTSPNAPAVYGVMGTPDPANTPGSRYEHQGWIDTSGNLLIFGGARAMGNFAGSASDLWKLDTTTSVWTWLNGFNGLDALGIYGTRGIPAPTNMPGARSSATTWTARDGTLWMFGGLGFGDTLPNPVAARTLNDMWRYQP